MCNHLIGFFEGSDDEKGVLVYEHNSEHFNLNEKYFFEKFKYCPKCGKPLE